MSGSLPPPARMLRIEMLKMQALHCRGTKRGRSLSASASAANPPSPTEPRTTNLRKTTLSASKPDEFLEKCRKGGGESFSIQKFMLHILGT